MWANFLVEFCGPRTLCVATPKNGRVMAKKLMPIYGIISIFREFLAHNLVKSQYFSMRPSLIHYYHQITYYLKVLAKYPKNPQIS